MKSVIARRSRSNLFYPALAEGLFFMLLLFMGCSQSPLCYRIGANYFPLEEGYQWIYLETGATGATCSADPDTVQIKVVGTANVHSRECWNVENNGVPEYFWKSDMRVDKFFSQTIFINGEEDTIAQVWVPWLQLPFIVDNSWEFSFSNQKIILDDTVKVGLRTKGKVISLNGNTFEIETQLIKTIHHSKYFNSYSDTSIYYEWYVPDTGITKRIINNTTTDTLLSFSFP